jgi:hypothetical protein
MLATALEAEIAEHLWKWHTLVADEVYEQTHHHATDHPAPKTEAQDQPQFIRLQSKLRLHAHPWCPHDKTAEGSSISSLSRFRHADRVMRWKLEGCIQR